jgi:hypothetical protein
MGWPRYAALVTDPKEWKPKLGRYGWVISAKVGAGDAESLFCGQLRVADIWVMADGIHWEIRDLPELCLQGDSGIWGADLDRPFWSTEGFNDVRKMINERVRKCSPLPVDLEDESSPMWSHLPSRSTT